MLLFLASAGIHSAAAQTRPAAANVRIILTVDKPSLFLGQSVLVHYCLENTSNTPIEIVDGSAHNRFKVAMTDERGTLVPARAISDPDELSTRPKIAPGNRWCKSFSLTQYARIDKPGIYDLRVIYEAGWLNAEPPDGRTIVELFMSNAWNKFEWDDENKKNGNVQHLREHGIEPEEAEECFFHDYDFCNDERFDDIYILDGRTDRSRRLRLVFQDKGDRLARVFTGWELKPKTKRKR